ncbi:hypothetical protein NUSPORA_02082 [Nucleospora cyclopteri]
MYYKYFISLIFILLIFVLLIFVFFSLVMPTISVKKSEFLKDLNENLSDTQIENICFDYGLEIDDIYEENNELFYKFDVAANRYDLLCKEGLIRALKTYLNGVATEKNQNIRFSGITVIKSAVSERNHVACAVIKDIDLNYESFIEYQEKLHATIGRNRSVLAVGTHDLDKIHKINGNNDRLVIKYRDIPLEKINFTPLNQIREFNGPELVSYYKKDKKMIKYAEMIKNKTAVFECNNKILSVPPLINSDISKISKETKNIFIEITGKDFHRVNQALIYILFNFTGGNIESIKLINDENSNCVETPVIKKNTFKMSAKSINEKLKLNLSVDEIIDLLRRMEYFVKNVDELLFVTPSEIRMDVLHSCDIIEDIAVAFGFNNFTKTLPDISTVGKENSLNKFTDKIREEMAFTGYNEALTLTLLNIKENVFNHKMVIVSNPKSREYEAVRTSLLPGLFKSVASNLSSKIPIKIFECSDIALCTSKKNRRFCSAVFASNSSKLEELQGCLTFVLKKAGFTAEYRSIADMKTVEHEFINLETAITNFIPKQTAVIIINSEVVGFIGVVSPKINDQFKVSYPMSAFEMDLEGIYKKIQ